MNIISMLQFGRTLTDREYGKNIAKTITKNAKYPLVLDFKGVMALGSSCGDEILNAITQNQKSKIRAINTNQAIKTCLEMVAEDLKIQIEFGD